MSKNSRSKLQKTFQLLLKHRLCPKCLHFPQTTVTGNTQKIVTDLLAQLLSAGYRHGKTGVRFPGQSNGAHDRCDVSSEPCCLGAKSRRWAPPLVTRFGEILRV